MVDLTTPISLRVSLTESCRLRCLYCRPAHVALTTSGAVAPWPEWLRRIRSPAAVVPVAKVRFTGGEPLLYPELLPLIDACAAAGLPDLALTTNGFRLAPVAAQLAGVGLKRVNISLDALTPATLQRMTGARLEKVIAAVDAALQAGLAVKLNTVVLRGINDGELPALLRFAANRGVPIRFLELMPIGPVARDFNERYVSGAEIKARLAGDFELEALPYRQGETSRDFRVALPNGSAAVCGLIMPTSTPFCDGCRRLRLTADGSLLGCLAQPDSAKLDTAIAAQETGNPNPLRKLVGQALLIKQKSRRFEAQRTMVRVGG